jgi:hypothetical protein
MNCFAVWTITPNKQIRVFQYNHVGDDRIRARILAIDFANMFHAAGHPCTVELFHMCDVGKSVYSTNSRG